MEEYVLHGKILDDIFHKKKNHKSAQKLNNELIDRAYFTTDVKLIW